MYGLESCTLPWPCSVEPLDSSPPISQDYPFSKLFPLLSSYARPYHILPLSSFLIPTPLFFQLFPHPSLPLLPAPSSHQLLLSLIFSYREATPSPQLLPPPRSPSHLPPPFFRVILHPTPPTVVRVITTVHCDSGSFLWYLSTPAGT